MRINTQIIQKHINKAGAEHIAPEKLINFVHQVDKQSIRITKLVDDMLDISRIRTGRLSVQKEEFDLCELVHEIIDRMKMDFMENSGSVPSMGNCRPIIGYWDKFRIEQIIINLLTNALKYGQGKPVKIDVEKVGECARLKVIDQGMGISEENLEIIFERFERGGITGTEISGLGLGLYITKQIVVSHGGRIWAESRLGEGSTFVVELPLKYAGAEE